MLFLAFRRKVRVTKIVRIKPQNIIAVSFAHLMDIEYTLRGVEEEELKGLLLRQVDIIEYHQMRGIRAVNS